MADTDCDDEAWRELRGRLFGLRRFGMKPGLERMRHALDGEGNPQKSYTTIAVGGTNGKGTVASLLSAILQSHGHRVGLYTSPHLIDVGERFRVDGVPLSVSKIEPTLRRLLEAHGRREENDQGLTFFELTTLAAAVLFEEQSVDYAIFEVGLGGRLDAVNSMDSDLAVVTTIGLDHIRVLGDDIATIAWEKAGIFRAGRPVVLGEQEFDAARLSLEETARDIGAIEQSLVDEASAPTDSGPILERHLKTAKTAARTLLKDNFVEEAFDEGISRWRWPGRFDVIDLDEGRSVFLDAAHNPAGVEALGEEIRRRGLQFGAVVWGAMGDKDPGSTAELLEEVNAPVWGSLIDNERARDAAELARVVPAGLWQGAAPAAEAFDGARRGGRGNLLVFGSIYLLGEILDHLGFGSKDIITYLSD